MKKLYQTEEEKAEANRERQRKWYNKNKKKFSSLNENPQQIEELKDILMQNNIPQDDVDDLITNIKGNLMNNRENRVVEHRLELSQHDFKRELDRRGNRDITGENFADEPGHNAKDANATKQGYFFKEDKIFFGNNGDFLDWDTHVTKGIGYGIIPGFENNTTSYWGVGATKFTLYRDGIPAYTGHSKEGRFFIRHFGYPSDVSVLNRTTIRELILGNDIPCIFQEYEVLEERYRDLVHADEFGFLPTHFVQIRRYEDSTMNYNAKKMVESLEFAFMCSNIEHDEIFVQVDDDKKVYCRQKYYPTVQENGKGHYNKVSNFRDLNCKYTDVKIADGLYDIYYYQNIGSDHPNHEKWLALREQTKLKGKKNGNDRLKLKGRGTNPRQIYVNHRGMHLIQEDTFNDMTKKVNGKTLISADNRTTCQDTVIILHEKSGEKEFPAIKTAGIDEETKVEAMKLHWELVRTTPEIQYSKRKSEDAKVDAIVDKLNTKLKSDTQTRDSIINSIQYLTDYELTMQDIENSKNRSVRENYEDGRNYDLLIAKNGAEENEYIFHAEFQMGSEDWPHIDQITSKILSNPCYYHVLVTDTLGTKKIKRDYFKRIMKQNNIQAKVWLCTNEELIKGYRDEFELIWDSKKQKEVAA